MTDAAIARMSQNWFEDAGVWALSRQYVFAGGFIILMAMTLVGTFASYILTRSAIEHTGASTALFMDSFLTPLVQELAANNVLKSENAEALERLLRDDEFVHRFPHLEIWKEGGVVAYSTTHELIGLKFPSPRGLISGLAGEVVARYTDRHPWEQMVIGSQRRCLEIYVPLRESTTGRIIAVAEIHEDPIHLQADLWRIGLQSWGAVAAATLVVMGALLVVVFRGNRIIDAQQAELRQRITEVEKTSRQNRKLRERAQRASSRVAEITEAYQRRVGADLHDGPAQLIGFAALKVEHVRRAASPRAREKELEILDSALGDALQDVRAISRGLMLPEIEDLPLQDIVAKAVRDHEQRTGTHVLVRCEDRSLSLNYAVKICIYRFLQEGLNNAFRHAGGNGQRVYCRIKNSHLIVAVKDQGCDQLSEKTGKGSGLGLIGLRERVESLGGEFEVRSRPGKGTTVEMRLLVEGEDHNA